MTNSSEILVLYDGNLYNKDSILCQEVEVGTVKTILIADDEKIERNGIKALLSRENLELNLLEASNGREALQMVQKHKPDVLFCDIKMPFISGLEVAERTKEISPDTAIIIISGYGDFEYARSAMKSGVKDYVLKPIDPAELRRIFLDALKRVEERERSIEMRRKNQDFLGEYFLQKFIYTGRPEVMEEAAGVIDISWWQEVGQILLIETVTDFFETCGEDFANTLLKELQLPFHYLNLESCRTMLLFDRKVKADFRVMAQHIHDYMLRQFRIQCYVAVSSPLECTSQMPKAFRETESLMENRFYRQDLWVFLPDKGLECKDNYDVVPQLFERMEEDIRLKDITHLWEHFYKFSELRQRAAGFSHIFVKFSCFNVIRALYREMHFSAEKCDVMVEKLYKCTTIEEILQILEENIRSYEQTIFANQSSAAGDVEKVKSYIYEHYAEELSVEILSEGVFLSPGYMSYIFKKETGEGLSHFIRTYRLEKAKDLLQNTSMKVNQICREVGFTNASYFGKSFREYYGCSPERFRKGTNINEESD